MFNRKRDRIIFMVNVREILKPEKFKVTLFLMLAIPCVTVITVILSPLYALYYPFYFRISPYFFLNEPLPFLGLITILVVMGLVVSYILGSLIDHYVQNEKLKIIIAVISGIISIVIVYALYKMVSEPLICDPVHLPNNNQTVCDPVHKPSSGENYHINILRGIEVDGEVVKDSFQKCIQNLHK
jgi:hypothetical protein